MTNLVGEQDARVALGDVEEQVSGVADLVGAFIGDKFEVVEAINPAIELRSVHPKHGIALDLFAGRIAGEKRNAILAFGGNWVAEGQAALSIGFGVPAL